MKFYDALTDFIFTEQKPEKADAIFVPGGLYGEIAQHAAELYQQGFASLIVPSGKYSIVEGKFTEVQSPEKYKGRYFETESDFLTQILVDEGVKKSDILQEKEASYTYQNALFTKDLLEKKGLHLKKVILSCQAYHARRCLMYISLFSRKSNLSSHRSLPGVFQKKTGIRASTVSVWYSKRWNTAAASSQI